MFSAETTSHEFRLNITYVHVRLHATVCCFALPQDEWRVLTFHF